MSGHVDADLLSASKVVVLMHLKVVFAGFLLRQRALLDCCKFLMCLHTHKHTLTNTHSYSTYRKESISLYLFSIFTQNCKSLSIYQYEGISFFIISNPKCVNTHILYLTLNYK